MSADIGALVGRTVTAIHFSEERLAFDTTEGRVTFDVEGDCCSWSYFFDFYGVEHLLRNGKITAAEEVDLAPGDPGYLDDESGELVVYGYRLTTEHPVFGPVSSVFSFRNSSNGYYGGWLYRVAGDPAPGPDAEQLTGDKIGGES